LALQSAQRWYDNLIMDHGQHHREMQPRGRVIAFARRGQGGDHTAAEVSPRFAALAEKLEATRPADTEGRIPDRIALRVLVAGAVLCWIGSALTPTMAVPASKVLWITQLASTLFWGAAFMAVVGLVCRVRRGLVAALAAALAFLSAPLIAPVLDNGVIGWMWLGELACAVAFVIVCVASLRSSGNGGSGLPGAS
jgi:peptidoglycan/LPS O-acetylase OafA/YrhL